LSAHVSKTLIGVDGTMPSMVAKQKIIRSRPTKKSATGSRPNRVEMQLATAADALEIVALRNTTAEKLTAKHGQGPWSGKVSDKGILFTMRSGDVYVVKSKDGIIATLILSTKKPWAIDKKYFTPAEQPLYLTAMAVVPDWQRIGLGRRCLQAALKKCKQNGADTIRLDAYDASAGAGPFYQKCGFIEVGRASYRDTPLIYYENALNSLDIEVN
jgi:GNAT superfamily N-acetyltransferase